MNILVVDDDKNQRDSLKATLDAWGHQTSAAMNGVEALSILEKWQPSVIITDLKMPVMDGFELLRSLRAKGNFPPTIVLTAFGSLDIALETVHELGGFWFLEKPISVAALELLIERAGAHSRLAAENQALRRDLSMRGVLCDLVGTSKPMQEIFSLIRQIAPTDVPALISGESGTGKELVARAIHTLSPRRDGPFIAVNCAALPETLMESEIFGHEKGAFTGAVERRAGCMELAENGTLFLDELAEMAPQMQAKLLRVLQDFRYRRLGGKQELVANVRVVAATNRPPQKAMESGDLREDLYYRLTVFHLHLPPLRERLDDLGPLAAGMVEALNQKYRMRVATPGEDVIKALAAWHWPGNVRELRNVLERAYILAGEGDIEVDHLPPHHRAGQPPGGDRVQRPGQGSGGSLRIEVGMTVDEAERILLEATLKHTSNNKTRAAMILGISTKTMHAKLRQYKLEDGDGQSESQPESD